MILMLTWLMQNAGSIIVGLVLLGIVAAIIVWIVSARRKGRSAVCSCAGGCGGCDGCPMSGRCSGTKAGQEGDL